MTTQTDLETQGNKMLTRILVWIGIAAVAIVLVGYFAS
jgi:hypothetical protein